MTTAEEAEQYGAIHLENSGLELHRDCIGFSEGAISDYAESQLKSNPTAAVHHDVLKYWHWPEKIVEDDNEVIVRKDVEVFFKHHSRRSIEDATYNMTETYCDYQFNPAALANIIYLANCCMAEQHDFNGRSVIKAETFVLATPTINTKLRYVQHVLFNFGKESLFLKNHTPSVGYKTPAQVAHQFACLVSERGFTIAKVKGSKVYIRPKLKDDNFEYHWIDSL